MDEEKEIAKQRDRMIQCGCMWANSAFRIKIPKKSGGGRLFSFTADFTEIAWGLVFAGITVAFLMAMWKAFGSGGPFFYLWSPMAWAAYGTIAFMWGRKMAHISPYRSYTGESATQWAGVVARKSFGRMMNKLGITNVTYNRVLTTMRDKSTHSFRVTWAREWLGIAPAPYAPHVSNPNDLNIHNVIDFCPYGEEYVNRFETLESVAKRYHEERQWRETRKRILAKNGKMGLRDHRNKAPNAGSGSVNEDNGGDAVVDADDVLGNRLL